MDKVMSTTEVEVIAFREAVKAVYLFESTGDQFLLQKWLKDWENWDFGKSYRDFRDGMIREGKKRLN